MAAEWHSLKHGHYNVFGFNFYPPKKSLNSTCIFGDEELRIEWQNEHTGIPLLKSLHLNLKRKVYVCVSTHTYVRTFVTLHS